MLGHILPRIGVHNWSHKGIAQLFSGIKQNGYEFIYLSARPIGFSNQTKRYINGLNQSGYEMPEGPVILSPDRTAKALYREII